MSIQRRRGMKAKVWMTKQVTDSRGNVQHVPDLDSEPYVYPVVQIPQRSARAEVPGQVEINIVRILIDAAIPDVDLWSRVELNGSQWDIVSPPALHYGTRRTRHWAIDLRRRPG